MAESIRMDCPATENYSALSDVDENDLAKRAQGGCASSFAELTRRFRPRLMNVLCKKGSGAISSEADDIIQDAFTKAWQNIERYDSRWQVSTWLYTITLRLASDYARKARRRQKGHAIVAPIAPDTANEIVERHDEAENLWNVAAANLSEVHYRVMWLRYAEELTIQEVARTLGRTVIATRVLLHRARAKLQSHLVKSNRAGGSVAEEEEST